MRVAITGANGVLGRNLLFEFMRQHISDLGRLQFVVLGRRNAHESLEQRVRDMLLTDGVAYLSAGANDGRYVRDYCESGIQCIEIDLDADGLGLSRDDLAQLRSAPIDFFFHAAALTDLRDSRVVARALRRTNVTGTRRVLELVSSLDVGQFCYVGSAYCCGKTTGRVAPDRVSFGQGFRNPYERAKLEGEVEVRRFAEVTGTRCRYFRPSIICGRLMQPPLGSISKFGVFYALAAFLLRTKLAMMSDSADVHARPAELDLRACCNPKGSLNVVPADYAAKVMYQVCVQDDPGDSYHVVNETETPNELFIALMPDALNIRGVKIVDRIPADPNRIEALYYKTVGGLFSPYALSEPMLFDTRNLADVLRNASLRCPPIDGDNFRVLMQYAKERRFGLNNGSPARGQPGPVSVPTGARAAGPG